MHFYVISVLILIPLLAQLSLIQPFIMGIVEKPIGPEYVTSQVGPGGAARGEVLYNSGCFGCHMAQANVSPALDTVDFTTRDPDDEAPAFAIRVRRDPMPIFTTAMLSDQELADIIAFIRSMPPQK